MKAAQKSTCSAGEPIRPVLKHRIKSIDHCRSNHIVPHEVSEDAGLNFWNQGIRFEVEPTHFIESAHWNLSASVIASIS